MLTFRHVISQCRTLIRIGNSVPLIWGLPILVLLLMPAQALTAPAPTQLLLLFSFPD